MPPASLCDSPKTVCPTAACRCAPHRYIAVGHTDFMLFLMKKSPSFGNSIRKLRINVMCCILSRNAYYRKPCDLRVSSKLADMASLSFFV